MKDSYYRPPVLTGNRDQDDDELNWARVRLDTGVLYGEMSAEHALCEIRRLMHLADELFNTQQPCHSIRRSDEFLVGLGHALGKLGRREEACKAFERFRAAYPSNTALLGHYLTYLMSVGDLARSAEIINSEPVQNIVDEGDGTARFILSLVKKHPELATRVRPDVLELCERLVLRKC